MQHLLAKPHSLALLTLAALALVDGVLAAQTPIAFTEWHRPVIAIAALLPVIAVYSRLRPRPAIVELAAYMAIWPIFTAVGCVGTYLAAAHAGPYRDDLLLSVDQALGFDWAAWVRWVHAHQALSVLLRLAYMSLPVQIMSSIAVFAAMARGRNEEFLVSATVAIVITATLSAAVPAVGPWIQFGLGAATPDDTRYVEHLASLHTGAASFRIADLQGIVCFPSYHTTLAALFVYCHRRIAWTFPAALVLNGVMLVSIPSEGGHYLADMLGGLAIAAIAIAATDAAMRARRSFEVRALELV